MSAFFPSNFFFSLSFLRNWPFVFFITNYIQLQMHCTFKQVRLTDKMFRWLRSGMIFPCPYAQWFDRYGLGKVSMCHLFAGKLSKRKFKVMWCFEETRSWRNIHWLVGWVLGLINLCRLFNAKSIFMQLVLFEKKISPAWVHIWIVKRFLFPAVQSSQTALIQQIQFCISTYFVYAQLNVKTVLY